MIELGWHSSYLLHFCHGDCLLFIVLVYHSLSAQIATIMISCYSMLPFRNYANFIIGYFPVCT